MSDSPCRWCREGMRLLFYVYTGQLFGARKQAMHAGNGGDDHQELRICNDPEKCITYDHRHIWQGPVNGRQACAVCAIERDERGQYVGYPR